MKKSDRILDTRLKKMIGVLREYTEEDELKDTGADDATGGQETQRMIPRVPPKWEKPGSQTKIQYLSTINMFTSNPPPGSEDWPEEAKKKPQFAPLTDARIVGHLSKFFPNLKTKSARAAKYSDYQFRVNLFGTLTASTEIKMSTSGKNKVEASLVSMSINNNAGLSPTGNKEALGEFKNEPLPLDVNLKDFRKWSETPEGDEPEIKKEEPKAGEPEPQEKEVKKKSPKEKSELEPKTKETEAGEPEPKTKETPSEAGEPVRAKRADKWDAKEHPMYDDLVSSLVRMGLENGPAARAAKKLLNKYDPKTDKEIAWLATNKKAYESTDLHVYLKNLLLEKRDLKKAVKREQPGAELEAGQGGDIVSELNDNLYENWFGKTGKGIAASVRHRVFKGNLFEWFAAENAVFRPKERKVDITSKGEPGEEVASEADVILKGEMIIDAELWFDARMGEDDKGLNTWTFHMLDGEAKSKKIGGPKWFKTPGIPRTDVPPKAAATPQQAPTPPLPSDKIQQQTTPPTPAASTPQPTPPKRTA
jgi:hypothetical protein